MQTENVPIQYTRDTETETKIRWIWGGLKDVDY